MAALIEVAGLLDAVDRVLLFPEESVRIPRSVSVNELRPIDSLALKELVALADMDGSCSLENREVIERLVSITTYLNFLDAGLLPLLHAQPKHPRLLYVLNICAALLKRPFSPSELFGNKLNKLSKNLWNYHKVARTNPTPELQDLQELKDRVNQHMEEVKALLHGVQQLKRGAW